MTSSKNKGNYGQLIYPILLLTDVVLVNLLFGLISFIHPQIYQSHPKVVWVLLNVAYIPVIFFMSKIHRERAAQMDHVLSNSLQAVGLHALFFVSILAFLSIDSIPTIAYWEFYGICFVALPLWWITGRQIIKYYRRKGRNFSRVIIIGTNATARRLLEELNSDAGFGYKVLGFFDENRPEDFKGNYIGTLAQVDDFVKKEEVDEIYYTLSGENENAIRTIIKIADDNVAQFYYVPQLSRYINRRFDISTVGAVPVLTARCNPLKKTVNRIIKRVFDLIFSSIVLICSPIIFIPVAIAIKISSPGPVFFKQLRTGYRGRDFYCWKFRTMRVNADSDKKQAQKDDPRKTRIGDLLRKTSIDELPQFINVFLGDMSIVGPRPHMLKHTQDYSRMIDKYMARHVIKPGITGWAQVNGYRGLTEELWQMEKRVEYDIWYIENWSFMLDLKIVVRTVLNAIHGEKNAF